MEKMEVDESETEFGVPNAMEETPAIAVPEEDYEMAEPAINDYMKYPTKKKHFVAKGHNRNRRVDFKDVAEMVTITKNGNVNVNQVPLRTEEEQSTNIMKYRKI
ncbi:uncharacterized protein LOC117892399 [Drosophila subobscura]|uniref:uncharacterized protein LOC117892399 n=1 Tax=Drosophila subobscura TaxID=7241 RepID=UPI00155A2263|nr:uncharacterized protein LOC117892399 [Drosophila subobscura]